VAADAKSINAASNMGLDGSGDGQKKLVANVNFRSLAAAVDVSNYSAFFFTLLPVCAASAYCGLQ
jgi:hypothetical protein